METSEYGFPRLLCIHARLRVEAFSISSLLYIFIVQIDVVQKAIYLIDSGESSFRLWICGVHEIIYIILLTDGIVPLCTPVDSSTPTAS